MKGSESDNPYPDLIPVGGMLKVVCTKDVFNLITKQTREVHHEQDE